MEIWDWIWERICSLGMDLDALGMDLGVLGVVLGELAVDLAVDLDVHF